MKKILLILCLTGAACGLVQAQKAPKVVTVDIEAVFSKYQKAVELTQLLENDAKQARQRDEATVEKLNGLRAEIEKLQKDVESPVLNEQGRANARAAVETKIQTFQREQNQFLLRKQQVEGLRQQRSLSNLRQVISDLRPIVDAIAKEKGADLVLSSSFNPSSVLYASPELDVTEEVIKRLNDGYTPSSTSVPASTAVPSVPMTPAAQ